MNHHNLKKIIPFSILAITLFSCVSNEKIIYMQKLEDSSGPLVESSERYSYQVEDYLLQANDILEISIKTTDPTLNEIFNVVNADNSNMAAMGGGQGAGDAFFMNGYSLDDYGNVEIPLVGIINILGLTTKEVKELVETKVKQYVKEDEYFVRVRLGGIRFSALGEFNRSGKYTILQNRVTIFEAIAFAGDLGRLAKRDEVILLRQYPDGSQIHKINLLDRELLGSEYFFLKPNDMIYAEPMKVREIGAGNTLVETVSLITATITAIALIVTLTRNN